MLLIEEYVIGVDVREDIKVLDCKKDYIIFRFNFYSFICLCFK